MFDKIFKKTSEQFKEIQKSSKNYFDILKSNMDFLLQVFSEFDNLILIITNKNLQIQYVNNGFLKTVNTKTDPVGESLNKFIPSYVKNIPIPDNQNYEEINLHLQDVKNEVHIRFYGIVYNHNDLLIFFLQKEGFTVNDFINKIFSLNQENADLKRKIALKDNAILQLNEKIKEMNTIDQISGLFNRRYLEHILDLEISRFKRYNTPLSMILIEMLDFKEIVHEHGRRIGDRLITSFGNLLKEKIRKTDFAGRYEGEDFLIILTNTPYEGAVVFMDRLKNLITSTVFAGKFNININIVAVECNKLDDVDSLIDRAYLLLKEQKYE